MQDLIDFFEWLNNYEELGYTKKGIRFYENYKFILKQTERWKN